MGDSANREKTTGQRCTPPHAWRPGESGNPAGRPKRTPDEKALIEACRQKAPEAMKVLVQLMKSADRDSVRLQAALAVLERGYGRPLQRQELATPGGFGNRTREELERSILERGTKLGFIIKLPKRDGDRKEE